MSETLVARPTTPAAGPGAARRRAANWLKIVATALLLVGLLLLPVPSATRSATSSWPSTS